MPEPSRLCLPVEQPRTCTYAEVAAGPPAHLPKARFVYVRRGGHAPPLAPLYMGPYEVLRKSAKSFTIRVGGKDDIVSVDRLKAHTVQGQFSRPLHLYVAGLLPFQMSSLHPPSMQAGGGALWRCGSEASECRRCSTVIR